MVSAVEKIMAEHKPGAQDLSLTKGGPKRTALALEISEKTVGGAGLL
jgi:hypothetical protein